MQCRSILWRLVSFLTYVLLGGLVFRHVENNEANDPAEKNLENLLIDRLNKAFNISTENITSELKDFLRNCACNKHQKEWSFLESIDFVLQLLTTIGYGNITPMSRTGKIFAVVYAIPGIPLTVLTLKSIGTLLNRGLRATHRPMHRKFHGPQCREEDCDFAEKGNVCFDLCGFILMWIIASMISSFSDPDRPLVTITYSIFITYSTIGFGDFIPFENSRYLFIIMLLPGLALMSSSIDAVVACIEKRTKLNKNAFESIEGILMKKKIKEKTTEAHGTQPKSDGDHMSSNVNRGVFMETIPGEHISRQT